MAETSAKITILGVANSSEMNSFQNWHQNVPQNSQEWNATGFRSLEYSLIKFILISMNVHSHSLPVCYMLIQATVSHVTSFLFTTTTSPHLAPLSSPSRTPNGPSGGCGSPRCQWPTLPTGHHSPLPIHRHVTAPPLPRMTTAHPAHCSPRHQGPLTATSLPRHLLG